MGGPFERTLKKELGAIELPLPARPRMDETVRLCRAAYLSRRELRRISGFEMILSQFRFIAKPIWALQLAVIVCMCFLPRLASGSEEAAAHVPAFLSVGAIFIAMTMLPFYGRSRKYKMRELESTTRLSLARLILAKLCVVGVGDVVCLIVLSLLSISKMTQAASALLTFIALPFLLTCTGSLLILNRAKEEYGVLVALGFSAGLAATCWMLGERLGDDLARSGAAAAPIVCALLLSALYFECRRLLAQIPSPDMQEALVY